MLKKRFVLMVFLTSCMAMVAPALGDPGDEGFSVTYRFEGLQVSGDTLTGYVLINVMNLSDQPVQNLSAWVPDGTNPALPHLPVLIGNLAAGLSREVLNPITGPDLPVDDGQAEGAVAWRIEFTDSVGEKRQIEVVGRKGF